MEDQFNGAVDQAVGRVEDAAGALTGDPKLQVDGKLKQAAGAAQAVYGKAKDKAEAVVGQAKDKAQDTYGEVEAYVREKPMAAVALGVGFGVLVGFLLAGGGRTVYVNTSKYWPHRS